MDKDNKFEYKAPETRVLECATEGIICLSGGKYPVWEEENI